MNSFVARQFSYFDLIKKFFIRITTILVAWKIRTSSRRHLAEMDLRMLNDIGLTEADRYQEVIKPFWKE